MRSWTAARTIRCWSIRLLPSNCEARTIARRWSPPPVSSTTSTSAPGRASAIIRSISERSATASAGDGRPAGRLEHLVDLNELDARTPERPAALPFGDVDHLPALEGHVVRRAFVEEPDDGVRIRGRGGRRELPVGGVGHEVVDRLLGVLLVRSDDARGPALDPTDDVLAGDVLTRFGGRDPAALVRD